MRRGDLGAKASRTQTASSIFELLSPITFYDRRYSWQANCVLQLNAPDEVINRQTRSVKEHVIASIVESTNVKTASVGAKKKKRPFFLGSFFLASHSVWPLDKRSILSGSAQQVNNNQRNLSAHTHHLYANWSQKANYLLFSSAE